jgi:hypothetical protein
MNNTKFSNEEKVIRRSSRVRKAKIIKEMQIKLDSWIKTGRFGDEKAPMAKSNLQKSAISQDQATNTATVVSAKSSEVKEKSYRSVCV